MLDIDIVVNMLLLEEGGCYSIKLKDQVHFIKGTINSAESALVNVI